MYGSDFFYPSTNDQQQQQQHEYDNLTFNSNPSHHYYDPFPILLDCQRCSRSADRSLLRDNSCQVPSNDEGEDDDDHDGHEQEKMDKRFRHYIRMKRFENKRSSPLYVSPSSTPPLSCQPPLADSLLSSYHFRRKRSLASYTGLHRRSRSVPSASSSTLSSISSRSKYFADKRKKYGLPTRPPIQPISTHLSVDSESVPVSSTPSTTALLHSIKTSIHAMKKRLKDIRRLSEVGMCC